jgi:hypothetical protein
MIFGGYRRLYVLITSDFHANFIIPPRRLFALYEKKRITNVMNMVRLSLKVCT